MSLIGRVLARLVERPRPTPSPTAGAEDGVGAFYAAAQRALEGGDLSAAVAPLRAILARSGPTPEVHANLGVALRARGEIDEAADHLHRAVAARPDLAVAWYNLGLLEFERARYDQAATAYRRAIELAPHEQAWQNSYLCLLNYAPGYTPMQVLDAHREWAARLPARPARTWRRAPASRRLRIGYVSADLRGHSVAYFIAPVLEHHDRGRYEVFCYDNHPQPDEVTARLRASAEHWREVHALDDDALERLILQDEIDLLVDLSGHTLGNRLPVFARKPAPVQATWIGYPQTTGLPTIDYRITDAHLDPPGTTEAFGTEALWRMPDCAVCFLPPEAAPAAGPLPAARSGRVTFGSVNQYFKITDEVVRTWARVLAAVPDATLSMIVEHGDRPRVAAAVRARFAAHGADAARIAIRGRADLAGFFRALDEIDIALDPFPYNGGTTTYHCLWAGVPVVTLAARTAIARCGAMILSMVGLSGLVAAEEAGYVDIAARLAADPQRLAHLRATLRERYRASPLYAAERFTRHLEEAYAGMWRALVERQEAPRP